MKQRGAKALFKRELTLGSLWSAFNHLDNKHLGLRAVSVVQTNSIAFKTDRGDSWIQFTGDIVNPAPGTFEVYEGDTLILTYQKQI